MMKVDFGAGSGVSCIECHAMASLGYTSEPARAVESTHSGRFNTLHQTIQKALRDRRTWKIIGIGQLLSVFICGTGVTSQLLQTYKFTAPLTQLFLTYLVLGLVFTTSLVYSKSSHDLRAMLRQRGWKYLLLGAIDVQANFAVVKAYQYTTLTSVQLLDGFSIPSVMFLSRFVLRSRFKWGHYLGVVICVGGMATLVVTDYFHNYRDKEQASKSKHNQIIGDGLCLLGAFLYATSNVCEEYLVKRVEISEFLGMLGFIASFICGIQILALERSELSQVDWEQHGLHVGLLAVGFALFQLMVYIVMPYAVRHSSAVTINLSLLTSDLYSLLLGLFLFAYKFSGLYFLAFVLILVGVILYTSFPAASSASGNLEVTRRANEPSAGDAEATSHSPVEEEEHSADSLDDQTEDGPLTAGLGAPCAVISLDSDAEHLAGDLRPLIQQPS